MDVALDIIKVKAKLQASTESGEAIEKALEEQREKKHLYNSFMGNEDGGYDHEALLRGLASIDTNIASLEQAIKQENAKQKLLEEELLGLEALSRMQTNDSSK